MSRVSQIGKIVYEFLARQAGTYPIVDSACNEDYTLLHISTSSEVVNISLTDAVERKSTTPKKCELCRWWTRQEEYGVHLSDPSRPQGRCLDRYGVFDADGIRIDQVFTNPGFCCDHFERKGQL